MGNLIEYIAKSLVDEPDDVRVTEHDDHGRIIVHLDVAEDDIGRVIGRDGRIATAMRSLIKVAAIREDVRVGLEIGD
ncbi:MAG: KH domain-containing protein [Dehalococcoidia bacterium]|nr:KH domain-containing protein [Chloroflexota bacterium]MXW25918.1 KH domain-containing protein [Dehalococcoidia bacterium]MXZ89407.1 KH domain-containing protein [Dehalococcoidia bacterium]MYA52032.1 KH domain-containing protein [Dehalococcoidia bacterium]MYH68328.1 KH domain-containing protein [Dehalococcoidia bacterium]